MTVEVFLHARMPDDLLKEFLQHLREFDNMHPADFEGEITTVGLLSEADALHAVDLDRPFRYKQVIRRRKKADA